ncbi:MAG: histidine kinase [Cytophagaceae bacterium]|nr:histidine kinase [Cytophagaceae bacterium]
MSITPFLIAFFLIRAIRKSLQTAVRFPKWDKLLAMAFFAAIALLVAEVTLDADFVTKWLWHLFLLSLVGIAFYSPEFRPVRTSLFAVAPYVVVSFLSDVVEQVAPTFFEAYDTYFSTVETFAIVWLFAIWISTLRQQKALEKERLKRLQEEEQNRIIAAQNTELERLVAERTAELTQQKESLEQTLENLKATQTQLIQSEKMASLGELTAGIAHEIQNPLNFVNNFSEVNVELLAELEEELAAGRTDDVLALATDIRQNSEKIIHHGKRADSIVKGMLEHSRTSTGEKAPTDINALADEYLRLAYHGLRAKNKDFNAALVTDFDPNLGPVEAIPQDMGRVLLNLFTNAFYATQERKQQQPSDYQPSVSVRTKRLADAIEIRVKDNGTGMPEAVRQKIFQPFFTTKPAGQGTGLGLSLSYDIVTKGHGGVIEVESVEGEGTEFIVSLPLV